MPARLYKPNGKTKANNVVLFVERWVIGIYTIVLRELLENAAALLTPYPRPLRGVPCCELDAVRSTRRGDNGASE